MAEVILKNVKKVYEDSGVLALSDFNINIRDKEFVVLVGPSGCGKSTTLRMIAGLDEITEGSIYIDGVLVNKVPPKDRDIAMVFQDYALYPHMTVYDNIAYGLKLRKYPKRVIDEKVREAAKILDIEDLLKRKPKALSGGQRQRVAIGRAIVRTPKVFLMDEPLSNLDAKLRNQMRAEILKLRKKMQTTFVYVTHDQTEAMTLGDRIVILKDGITQQIGAPKEVFSNPANIFVAGFIGTPQMNFFKGRLVKRDRYYIATMDREIALSDERQAYLRGKNTPPQDITIGVRPEHMNVSKSETYSGGTIDVVEMMGSSIYIHFNFMGNSAIALARDKDVDLSEFKAGNKVLFDFNEENIHIFDEEGLNLEYELHEEEFLPEIDNTEEKNAEETEENPNPEETFEDEEARYKKSGEKEKHSFIDYIMSKKNPPKDE
ncbi:MAG: ABC transporter ATP-binding protein [Firmicutes bacterium]|nr:ABC transporter ATP-binding protein [Bacillota bacterium]